jgi:hypothetical protein
MNIEPLNIHAQSWLRQHLTDQELHLLESQGFVSAYRLPSGSICYKLRFRNNQKCQRVIYIGTDSQKADAVRAELHQLQARHIRRLQLNRLVSKAASLLRATKERLRPYIERNGLRFHGYALRQQRTVDRSITLQQRGEPGNEHQSMEDNTNEDNKNQEACYQRRRNEVAAPKDQTVLAKVPKRPGSASSQPWHGRQRSDGDRPATPAGDRGGTLRQDGTIKGDREDLADFRNVPEDQPTSRPVRTTRQAADVSPNGRPHRELIVDRNFIRKRRLWILIPTVLFAQQRGPPGVAMCLARIASKQARNFGKQPGFRVCYEGLFLQSKSFSSDGRR